MKHFCQLYKNEINLTVKIKLMTIASSCYKLLAILAGLSHKRKSAHQIELLIN